MSSDSDPGVDMGIVGPWADDVCDEIAKALAEKGESKVREQLLTMGLPLDPDALHAELERRFPGKELVLETGPVESECMISRGGGYEYTYRRSVELKLLDKGWRKDIPAAQEEDE